MGGDGDVVVVQEERRDKDQPGQKGASLCVCADDEMSKSARIWSESF